MLIPSLLLASLINLRMLLWPLLTFLVLLLMVTLKL